jgi:hypothetical protein
MYKPQAPTGSPTQENHEIVAPLGILISYQQARRAHAKALHQGLKVTTGQGGQQLSLQRDRGSMIACKFPFFAPLLSPLGRKLASPQSIQAALNSMVLANRSIERGKLGRSRRGYSALD